MGVCVGVCVCVYVCMCVCMFAHHPWSVSGCCFVATLEVHLALISLTKPLILQRLIYESICTQGPHALAFLSPYARYNAIPRNDHLLASSECRRRRHHRRRRLFVTILVQLRKPPHLPHFTVFLRSVANGHVRSTLRRRDASAAATAVAVNLLGQRRATQSLR